MPPLATGLGLGIFVVLIIISIMIQKSRRYNKLMNVPDDSCDDDINRAAKALLDDLEPKALRKRKAPKGVFVTAKIRRAEIIRARDLLRKRPR